MQGEVIFLGIKEFEQEMGNKAGEQKESVIKKFGGNEYKNMSLGIPKKFSQTRNLKIIPPISKRSPKYADHLPNAGHGFAAMYSIQRALN